MSKRRRRSRLNRILKAMPEAAAEALRAELLEVGQQVLGDAQAKVPVRTGNLKSQLSARRVGRSFQVKVGVVGRRAARQAPYARFVEFGRYIASTGTRVTPQPFLVPAWKRNEKAAKTAIAREIRRHLRRVAKGAGR